MKLSFVIPCFNEGPRLSQTLEKVDYFFSTRSESVTAVVIDDGSLNPVVLPSYKHIDVITLRHLVNMGQGAALQTGFDFINETLSSDITVTFDADGQHRIEDLDSVIGPIVRGEADCVFGNRFHSELASYSVPPFRRLLLRMASVFESWLTGLYLSDAHNGYRAFNSKTLSQIRLTQNRMAHATEIKSEIAELIQSQGIKLVEAPVTITYTDETLAKGQKSSGAFKILKELFDTHLYGD
ncbi:MAG: glycosyltransferase family 2 protein [Xanthomonadaceae bacterium]|nr:glycosyltransferase family 2 protein [Xanthomonadaceae bacterium]